jgi:hypothetical protein
MAKTVQILGSTKLPGLGISQFSGSRVTGKVSTWGIVTIPTYTSGGEPLVPNDVGLTAVDFIRFSVDIVDAAALGTVEGSAIYQYKNQKVHVYEAAANVADISATLRFFAIGDSANNVESL